jgi:hypothetical protein
MKKHYIESRKRGISYIQKRKKGHWVGHILHRNCLLKHVIERKLDGRIEITGRRGRRRTNTL